MKEIAAALPELGAEQVAAWLARHPQFLAARPELYRLLAPPKRVHGETLADHMAAMLAAERAGARALEGEMRVGALLGLRARLAVLALLAARDVAEVVAQEWPALLHVAHCALLAPLPATWRAPAREVTLRVGAEITDAATLHAEAAGLILRDALVRVPLATGAALLVLGARADETLPSTETLVFLGRAIAAALAR